MARGILHNPINHAPIRGEKGSVEKYAEDKKDRTHDASSPCLALRPDRGIELLDLCRQSTQHFFARRLRITTRQKTVQRIVGFSGKSHKRSGAGLPTRGRSTIRCLSDRSIRDSGQQRLEILPNSRYQTLQL
jgi:hypothetical protein